ncbi:hypothetical protein A3728_06100 [Sulfitobacter sp. HI0040]|nr:hypothetical protein A3721_19875 [Sulfitobacter sp. HI0023]KZY24219.1 hypothetical protein A3728_06100 [Sulfitobacter sp. HI0040]KZZ70300.1 hypothetical protein A3764_07965 [Sulfitobacter sp. HI0129]
MEARGELPDGAKTSERHLGAREKSIADAELDKLIRDLLKIQEDRCAITGLPFQFQGAQTDDNMLPSLDRIDSNGHYARDNLQIVCRFINFWRQAPDDTEFRRLV